MWKCFFVSCGDGVTEFPHPDTSGCVKAGESSSVVVSKHLTKLGHGRAALEELCPVSMLTGWHVCGSAVYCVGFTRCWCIEAWTVSFGVEWREGVWTYVTIEVLCIIVIYRKRRKLFKPAGSGTSNRLIAYMGKRRRMSTIGQQSMLWEPTKHG